MFLNSGVDGEIEDRLKAEHEVLEGGYDSETISQVDSRIRRVKNV
jgi:hypothetical protein